MMVRDDAMASAIGKSVFGREFVQPFSGFVAWENGWPRLIAVFNHYTRNDVHLTMAASAPMRLSDVRQIARLAFEGLGVARVTAICNARNDASESALKRMGFVFEGVMRKHFGEDDGVVFGLLRSEQNLIRCN